MNMQTRIIRTLKGFRDLQDAWDDLARDSRFQAPFHCWTWYDAWWKHFGAGCELFLIVGEDGNGRLQMVAPLMKTRRLLRGLPVREIGFLANSISPANAILVRRDFDEAAALAAVVACLVGQRRRWDMLKLWNLPASVSLLDQADAIGPQHRLCLFREPGWRSAYIAPEGDFETYLTQQFGKNRLRGIRQKVRQLSRQPGYRLAEFRTPAELEQGLELAFSVSKASWKGKLGTDMGGAASRRAFYVDITRRLAERGEVRIWASILDHTPLAVHYQLVAPDATYLIINDYRQEYHAQSPGTVLMYQAAERLFQEPQREFRFSGDLYDYKSLWATGMHRHATLEFFHDGFYSRFLSWAKRTALPAFRRVQRLARPSKPEAQAREEVESRAEAQPAAIS
jgi:CelD/BcsL family acetyltransferase involved in cellulose biosynthesis